MPYPASSVHVIQTKPNRSSGKKKLSAHRTIALQSAYCNSSLRFAFLLTVSFLMQNTSKKNGKRAEKHLDVSSLATPHGEIANPTRGNCQLRTWKFHFPRVAMVVTIRRKCLFFASKRSFSWFGTTDTKCIHCILNELQKMAIVLKPWGGVQDEQFRSILDGLEKFSL